MTEQLQLRRIADALEQLVDVLKGPRREPLRQPMPRWVVPTTVPTGPYHSITVAPPLTQTLQSAVDAAPDPE